MYEPEEYRRKRRQLREEIEANRTPEQKAEAARIRAQRAAYEALPNGEKTELEELDVFRAFAAVAELGVDPGSEVNVAPPRPDIRCTLDGDLRYFEFGEITDQRVARAAALTDDGVSRATAFSPTAPLDYMIDKKRTRTYETGGVPVDLVLCYRTEHAPPLDYFAHMTSVSTMYFIAAVMLF